MKDKYLTHLGILFIGVLIVAFFFNYFKFNTTAQIIVAGVGCVYYIVWGVSHHAVRNRLSRLITLEYILVGSLIFLLLLTSLSI